MDNAIHLINFCLVMDSALWLAGELSVRKYYLPFEQPGLYLKTCSHPVFLCIFCFVVNHGYKGITTFVVPKETDGLSLGKKEDKV